MKAKVSFKRVGILADGMLLSVAVIWGLGFPVTQMAVDARISASLILVLRFGIAAALLGAVFFRRVKTITTDELAAGGLAGFLLGIGYLLQTVGIQHTTPSNNAFFTATNVIIVPFLSWLVYRQRPAFRQCLAACGCFVGAVVLSFSPRAGIRFNLGDLLTLGCALVFSVHFLYLGNLAGRIDTGKLTFLQMAFAALFCFCYLLLFERRELVQADFGAGFLPICYLGVLSTCYCFFAQTFAQKHTTATKTSILLGTEGLFGAAFSVLLGYESLTANLVVGGTVIFVSLLMMELFPQKVKTAKEVVPEDCAAGEA